MASTQQVIDQLVQWVHSTTPDSIDLLVPVSGGTDSALCFYICNQALPGRVLGVHAGSDLRFQEWFESIGQVRYIPVNPSGEGWEVELARWTAFTSLAIHENRILVGSRNRTEQGLGTYSVASRVAWYYPIIGVWKQDVLDLCRYIGVPAAVIISSSEADPACGRPEELAKTPHHLIDEFVKIKIGEATEEKLASFDVQQLEYLEKIYKRNLFKQSLSQEGPKLSL